MEVDKVIDKVVARFIGTKHERDIKKISPVVVQINALEPEMKALSDAEMRARTTELRAEVLKRLGDASPADTDYKGKLQEALEQVLVPAFALVREAGRRTLNMRHFDVQLIGGIVLHQGKIAEMKTGEGKTLTATLALYLNALTGKGVHLVTVNDYLARRDSEWMSPIYTMLGLTVACLQNSMSDEERRVAYAADILYATNNELGFDYLRDNMKFRAEDYVQRPLYYAIVDEVDSILIDEARTPLIISGSAEQSSKLYGEANRVMERLVRGEDYEVDEKARS